MVRLKRQPGSCSYGSYGCCDSGNCRAKIIYEDYHDSTGDLATYLTNWNLTGMDEFNVLNSYGTSTPELGLNPKSLRVVMGVAGSGGPPPINTHIQIYGNLDGTDNPFTNLVAEFYDVDNVAAGTLVIEERGGSGISGTVDFNGTPAHSEGLIRFNASACDYISPNIERITLEISGITNVWQDFSSAYGGYDYEITGFSALNGSHVVVMADDTSGCQCQYLFEVELPLLVTSGFLTGTTIDVWVRIRMTANAAGTGEFIIDWGDLDNPVNGNWIDVNTAMSPCVNIPPTTYTMPFTSNSLTYKFTRTLF